MPDADTQSYRAWKPGDGLLCNLHGRAARDVPCGPPVVSRVIEDKPAGRGARKRPEVLCVNHLASRFIRGGIGILNAELDREAREAVLAAHWDEYLAERAKRRGQLHEQIAAAVPEEFRPLVREGLAAHEQAQEGR